MAISGIVAARCNECKCVFTQNLDNWIFIDSEVIGTCDSCFHKDSHSCIDVLQIDENEQPIIVGKKVFIRLKSGAFNGGNEDGRM